jgi:hypothetical protein
MKAYLATTGVLFVIVLGAHAWRVTQESHLARDPWFIFTTVAATALALWALTLFRRMARR